MKSMHNAGQFKLRGKKTLLCYCRCCVVQDFRGDYFTKLVNKGLQQAKRTFG